MIKKEDLDYKGYFIYQDTDGYRFTSDAVLLANFVKATSSDRVIDLGTGSGIIAILIAVKTEAREIVGIDINRNNLQLAMRSVSENCLSDRVKLSETDIKNAAQEYGHGSFSIVVCNPPYFPLNSGEMRESPESALARHEIAIDLEGILKSAAALVKYGGKLYMVHKARRLAELIIIANRYRFTAKKIVAVVPSLGKSADTVLVEFKLGAKESLELDTLLVSHENSGKTGNGD